MLRTPAFDPFTGEIVGGGSLLGGGEKFFRRIPDFSPPNGIAYGRKRYFIWIFEVSCPTGQF